MWLPEYFWKLTIISGHDEKERIFKILEYYCEKSMFHNLMNRLLKQNNIVVESVTFLLVYHFKIY